MPISKATYSLPATWRVDDEAQNTNSNGLLYKQLATGGPEVSSMKLCSGAAAASIDIYDWTDNGTHTPPSTAFYWRMSCSNTSNDNNPMPNPIAFKYGVFALCTQGAGDEAALLCTIISPKVNPA